uniref:Uncharacterized protein n=1 Tax=Parascaris equorum TaxID=6256 RepID=A0A914RZ21_PAREQ
MFIRSDLPRNGLILDVNAANYSEALHEKRMNGIAFLGAVACKAYGNFLAPFFRYGSDASSCDKVFRLCFWIYSAVSFLCIGGMAPSVTAVDDAQQTPAEQLSNLDLNTSPERRCVGRCDMELGDVTHHNVQVRLCVHQRPLRGRRRV